MEKPQEPGPKPPVPQASDVELNLNRCPFCHEGVRIERSDWVSCRTCQARHHTACWQEGGQCSACGDALFMAVAEQEPGPSGPAPTPQLTFFVEAIDHTGSKVRHHVQAGDKAEAIENTKALGLFPIKVRREAPSGEASHGDSDPTNQTLLLAAGVALFVGLILLVLEASPVSVTFASFAAMLLVFVVARILGGREEPE